MYADWVEANLDVGIKSQNEWMTRCPKHEDAKPSLQINVEKGLFVCFSCGWKGSIKRIGNYLGVNVAAGEISDASLMKLIESIVAKPEDSILVRPESYLRRYTTTETNYWRGRGFTMDTINKYQLGYDVFANAATIPVRGTNGELYGVTRRFMANDSPVKYKYPKHFIRRNNLFGSWVAKSANDTMAVLVEGGVDQMAVDQAGYLSLATYGSSLSRMQVRLLYELGIESVVLFFDDDDAGREATYGKYDPDDRSSYKPGAAQLLHEFDVSVVKYKYAHQKDPGGMAHRPGLIQAEIEAARPFRM